jgi:hypothetical protein
MAPEPHLQNTRSAMRLLYVRFGEMIGVSDAVISQVMPHPTRPPYVEPVEQALRWTRETQPMSLLQFRVLRFCLFQNGNVRVGIFPQGEEVLIVCSRL